MQYKTLTSFQAEHYREHGYVRIGALVAEPLLSSLRREYDLLFSEARVNGGYRNLAIDKTADVHAKADGEGQMLQIEQVCERSILFRKLLYNEQILDIVEDLIGPNIQLYHDQALHKPADTGAPVFWHQDNGYWKCVPAEIVTCWLTLDAVDAENGAMHVVPGSHVKLIEHKKSVESNALLETQVQPHIGETEVIELPAGGVMFHHCQVLHYTPANRTNRQRRAFAIHFMRPGTRTELGAYFEVSFSRPMLRAHI